MQERLHHEVTSSGNPITMDLKTRYKIKGIGSEQTIESVVKIFTNGEGRIIEVQDRWNDNIPEGPFAKVSCSPISFRFYLVGLMGVWDLLFLGPVILYGLDKLAER